MSPALVTHLLRFGVVGFTGFAIDTAVVYALRHSLGLYGAGLASYLIAASCNWALNRFWTFSDRPRRHAGQQWGLFLLTNLLGLVLNRGCYAMLVANSSLVRDVPILATAGGAVAGMGVNFIVARNLVFR